MNYWKQIALQWNACRIIRIIAGIPVLVMGINTADWATILFGSGFIALGLFSTQCCSSAGCYPGYTRSYGPSEKIEFEELKKIDP